MIGVLAAESAMTTQTLEYTVPPGATPARREDKAIRPFRVNIPEGTLTDLRARILATRWPGKETVTDRSQGVQLARRRRC